MNNDNDLNLHSMTKLSPLIRGSTVHLYNFEISLRISTYVEITSGLVSAYDFYSRVVKDP